MRGSVLVLGLVSVLVMGCGGDDDGGGGGDGGTDGGGGGGWEALADVLGGPVQETAVVELGGLLYVMGGIDDGLTTLDQVLVYDPAEDAWDTAPDLPMPVHHANAAMVDGTIYVVGSLDASFAPIADVWSWSPGDGAWSSDHEPMDAASARGASMVGVVDELIVVAGGSNDDGSLALVSTYDPAGDAWDEAAPDLPVAIDHGTGQVVDGVFYTIGGRTDGIGNVTDAVYALDGGDWVARAAMPTARGGVGSGVVAGTIVVVGGEGNDGAPGGVFPQTERYDPAADAWTALPDMRTPRHGMGVAGLGDYLYVPGGADNQGFGAVATFERLRAAP
ncbi:MAG TPA: kelch repeat-containing protein [Kofleriaceae bacterium]|nr:kelch repeat-containing protein [Kofleriaceae bacterium]